MTSAAGVLYPRRRPLDVTDVGASRSRGTSPCARGSSRLHRRPHARRARAALPDRPGSERRVWAAPDPVSQASAALARLGSPPGELQPWLGALQGGRDPVPFEGCVRFMGQHIRFWDRYDLSQYRIRTGCFSQDARGRWYLNVVVRVKRDRKAAQPVSRGIAIDLGLKDLLATSGGIKVGGATVLSRSRGPACRRAARRQARSHPGAPRPDPKPQSRSPAQTFQRRGSRPWRDLRRQRERPRPGVDPTREVGPRCRVERVSQPHRPEGPGR